MSNINSIYQAVEFIEANLQQEITIADIADSVYYSLYHFSRMFNKLTHHTPYDYVIRRRLSESAKELINSDKKIIDIAYDYQFNNPETYSRAFKKMFAMQPMQWKKQGLVNNRLSLSKLSLDHIEHRTKGNYSKPVLEKKTSQHYAGLMTLVTDSNQAMSKLWTVFRQELRNLIEVERSNDYYAIMSYPDDWQTKGFFYMAATKVLSLENLNSILVVKTIPASNYGKFIHDGPIRDLPLMLDYIYQTWLAKSGQSLRYPLEIINYGRDYNNDDNLHQPIEIYIPIL